MTAGYAPALGYVVRPVADGANPPYGFMLLSQTMSDHGKLSACVPAELLASVVAYFRPRRVILFGSQARRDAAAAGADNDIDLLVELDDDAPIE